MRARRRLIQVILLAKAADPADGGEALAAYEDPIGGHWHIFALLPLTLVEGTPYQRDLSPAPAAVD